jgi:uncharacterized protein (DUF2225 family)
MCKNILACEHDNSAEFATTENQPNFHRVQEYDSPTDEINSSVSVMKTNSYFLLISHLNISIDEFSLSILFYLKCYGNYVEIRNNTVHN